MKPDLYKLSRKLREMAEDQQYEERRLLETAANVLFRMAGIPETEQNLTERLHKILEERTLAGFTTALGMHLSRADLNVIIGYLDPHGDFGPEGHLYRDARGSRLRVDDIVCTASALGGDTATVVGLGTDEDPEALVIRIAGKTRCQTLHPSKVMRSQ